jgi:hypothetical protein
VEEEEEEEEEEKKKKKKKYWYIEHQGLGVGLVSCIFFPPFIYENLFIIVTAIYGI